MELISDKFNKKSIKNDKSFLVVLEEELFINHIFNRKNRKEIEESISKFLLLKNTEETFIDKINFMNKYLSFFINDEELNLNSFSRVKDLFFKEFGLEWFLSLNPKWYKLKEEKEKTLTKSDLEKGINIFFYSLLLRSPIFTKYKYLKELSYENRTIVYETLHIFYSSNSVYYISLKNDKLNRKIKENIEEIKKEFKILPDNYFDDKISNLESNLKSDVKDCFILFKQQDL